MADATANSNDAMEGSSTSAQHIRSTSSPSHEQNTSSNLRGEKTKSMSLPDLQRLVLQRQLDVFDIQMKVYDLKYKKLQNRDDQASDTNVVDFNDY